MRQNQKSYILIALFSITALSGLILGSAKVLADTIDIVNITVPESCTLTTSVGSGQTYHENILNGQYKNNIGKTRISVFCNTEDTFAIYAVGYSNDTIGSNEMISSNPAAGNIVTGTATSGNTSNWAMKVEAIATTGANTYTPTIISPFNDFASVPTNWAKVAEVASVNNNTNEAAIDASYAVYIAPKQPGASYTGKVRYTVVHPTSVDPNAGQANLAAGIDVNKKLKSLASGTDVANHNTTDNLITAFIRSDTLPTNFTPSDANTISLSSSLTPVYVWFDSNDGTIYYYSKAKDIYMSTDPSYLFNNMKSLTDISGLKYFIANNLASISQIFDRTQISDLTPLTNWDVSNVGYMNNAFASTKITNLAPISNWNVGKVREMRGMFSYTQISDLTPITNWNVENVRNMGSVFSHTQISDLTPLAGWNTGNAIDISSIFASTLVSDLAPISNWDISNVKYANTIFHDTKISNLWPIANWDTSSMISLSSAFKNTDIYDLTPIKDWDTSSIKYMSELFANTKIISLQAIAGWDTSSVSSMYNIFTDIPTLVDASPIYIWDIRNISNNIPCKTSDSLNVSSSADYVNCFYQMFGGSTPKTNLPIFTSRPGTWDSSGTYIPNP